MDALSRAQSSNIFTVSNLIWLMKNQCPYWFQWVQSQICHLYIDWKPLLNFQWLLYYVKIHKIMNIDRVTFRQCWNSIKPLCSRPVVKHPITIWSKEENDWTIDQRLANPHNDSTNEYLTLYVYPKIFQSQYTNYAIVVLPTHT